MKYKAILFDMDGVILDSEPLHTAAFQTTLMEHGKELSDDGYKQHFAGKTDKAGFEDYFDFINETVDIPLIMDQKTKIYLQLAADRLQGYPGMVALIKELSQTTQLALVTGSLRVEAEVALKALGITDCFEVTVTANDIEHSKPHPEGYLKAAALLGVDKEECVIVEDSPSGIMAALAAGIRSIGVTNTHTASELAGADLIVDSLDPSLFSSDAA